LQTEKTNPFSSIDRYSRFGIATGREKSQPSIIRPGDGTIGPGRFGP
jgi:hypothetical protein